jgi:hypothetical protein
MVGCATDEAEDTTLDRTGYIAVLLVVHSSADRTSRTAAAGSAGLFRKHYAVLGYFLSRMTTHCYAWKSVVACQTVLLVVGESVVVGVEIGSTWCLPRSGAVCLLQGSSSSITNDNHACHATLDI